MKNDDIYPFSHSGDGIFKDDTAFWEGSKLVFEDFYFGFPGVVLKEGCF